MHIPRANRDVCVYVIISKARHTPLSAYAVADTPAESTSDVGEMSVADSAQAAAAGAGTRERSSGAAGVAI